MGVPGDRYQRGRGRQRRSNDNSTTREPGTENYRGEGRQRSAQGYPVPENHNQRGPEHQRRSDGSTGGTPQSSKTAGSQRHCVRSMSFVKLQSLVDADISDIFIEIAHSKRQFMELLHLAKEKHDVNVLILQLMCKVAQSTMDQLKLQLILEICNSSFIQDFSMYLLNLPYAQNKGKNHLYWSNPNQFWENFLNFFECVRNLSPSTAYTKCRPLIENISKCCLEVLRETQGLALPDEFYTKLSRLRDMMAKKEENTNVRETRTSNNATTVVVEGEPPTSFREISILPTEADLLEEVPFVRPNIVDGAYSDIEHYLDVQFRLLREDCLGPLRDGIKQFLAEPKRRNYDGIRVYHKVVFTEPYVSNMTCGHVVQLNKETCKRFQSIKWQYNKRFLYGSLVIFVNEETKTFIVATILDRQVYNLINGKIPVLVVGNEENLSYKDFYTMLESEVYFEPYFHVLNVLKHPSFAENMSMKKYIVDVDPQPNPPQYLISYTDYEVETEDSNNHYFEVLNFATWPTCQQLNMNQSQYEAYKLALTHEFSVIQGPPGTGKTYLGIKIAQTLLTNIKIDRCLMLVICYTNHALDQFLEAILKITDSVVRIGGQSRSEDLKKHNLNELRASSKGNNSKHNSLLRERRFSFNECERSMKQLQKNITSLSSGIVHSCVIKKYVAKSCAKLGSIIQIYDAEQREGKSSEDPLSVWLFQFSTMNLGNDLVRAKQLLEKYEESLKTEKEDKKHSLKNGDTVIDELEDENVCQLVDICSSTIKQLMELLKTNFSVIENSSAMQQIIPSENCIKFAFARIETFQEMHRLYSEENLTEAEYEALCRQPTAKMSLSNRWKLYFNWVNDLRTKLQAQVRPLQVDMDRSKQAYEEAKLLVDLDLIKHYEVIGMTTTAAARVQKLLDELKPPIVIVEEAAEVFEQHIITSLSEGCEHLILIGDHQQLRPSAACMKLAREYNIEVSLFERMINNKIHSRRLSVQHRMRPEIASLISPHIYPDLLNHPSVERFPNVKGMKCNMFFWTHDFLEQKTTDGGSKSNSQEGDLVLKLANYLMQQGYQPEDVTILAAYSAQMFYLRKEREKYVFLKKIQITVVDNYQGEESKIILLSLVRNNAEGKIGFLQTENRVCVALSRAREGFYIFGNITMLKSKSDLWAKISQTLEEKGLLGQQIQLKCENHPDTITTVTKESDFEFVPEGGCLQKCLHKLKCLHPCPLVCHGYDNNHESVQCILKCERVICELDHVCPLMCNVTCQPCKVKVEKTLPCKHLMTLRCFEDPASNHIKCLTLVDVVMPDCGHDVSFYVYNIDY
ncbi:NFX1-type zinc finger-containing protein 1-like [Leptidea sinapis]|uniref:NFX1-type zinc finger-containing protein 1-like n=1 Tax=Leptidea sinapis TaxID=189913 RepID=UPI0021C3FDBD|nr:NFX1-type zinc finger-containing protein 1-like [Leptidea sinapis]